MLIPRVTCFSDVILYYDASSRVIQLGATATNGPITSWRWSIKSVPVGSTANIGNRGNFVNGVSTIQNPQIVIDGGIDGGYCFECIATNSIGSSNPKKDLKSGQQSVIVKTQTCELCLPGEGSYGWGQYYLNPSLRILEAAISIESDPSPTYPSIYDDEFDGSILDTKWSWLFAGAPTSGVESYYVGDGKLNVFYGFGGSNFSTAAHVLAQPIPIDSSFTVVIKLSSSVVGWHPYPTGIYLGPASWDAGSSRVLTFGIGADIQDSVIYYGGYNGWAQLLDRKLNSVNTYLKVDWNNVTKEARCWIGLDSQMWVPVYPSYYYNIHNTLTRFGLVFWAPDRHGVPDGDRNFSSINFFRVTIL